MNKNVTIVTGLWDLGREKIEGWGKRNFSDYEERFYKLLETNVQMCVWIPKDLEEKVLEIRGDKPTKIFIKNNEDFKTWNPFFDKIQEIRLDPKWYEFAGWLKDSPQASLEYYNAMMFTKMFMLNDSAVVNPFNSEYFFWIDGGITHTVNPGYFINDNVFDNLENYVLKNNDKYIHLTYPYDANEEIHGFERKSMARWCGVDFVKYVARGGFFGGSKEKVHQINTLYYSVMENTLKEGLMGADECLFTILCHKHEDIIHRFQLTGDGLVWRFFEHLKEYSNDNIKEDINFLNPKNTGLYIITFNSPNQVRTLIKSMLEYDENFVYKPKLILLDNSTDLSTTEKYSEVCKEYNIEHIKKDNLGICGGRQWIAEDAEKRGFDFYFFFEDDMFFYPKKGEVCKNGFNRYVKNLYDNSIKILMNNQFDFLKLSFSEFYGDNRTQWAWYNVPQDVREKFWPEKPKLPNKGLDPNAPKTKFTKIDSYNGIPFAHGEIYYCNWPQVVSKYGNKKMFLTEKWDRPFEQTWMSYMYQETVKGKMNPGILLITPTEHDRFDHYDGKLRKES